jgi:hypothetical protein
MPSRSWPWSGTTKPRDQARSLQAPERDRGSLRGGGGVNRPGHGRRRRDAELLAKSEGSQVKKRETEGGRRRLVG